MLWSVVPLSKARKDVNKVGNWYFMWCIFSRWRVRAVDLWKSRICGVSNCSSCRAMMKHEAVLLRKVGTLCTWAVKWAVNRIPRAAEAVKLNRQKETCYIITGYISYERYYNILNHLIFKVWISANLKHLLLLARKLKEPRLDDFEFGFPHHFITMTFTIVIINLFVFFSAIRLRQFKFNINFCVFFFNGLDDMVINWRKLFKYVVQPVLIKEIITDSSAARGYY